MKKILISTSVLVFAFAISASATVATPPTYTLKTSMEGTGSGSLSINISGATSTQTVLSTTTKVATGAKVTVTAVPTNTSKFLGWSGGACVGSKSTTCSITINQSRNITAKFNAVKVDELNKTELKTPSAACAKAALTKRDNVVIAAIQKYTTDWLASMATRSEKQKLAFEKTGSERLALIKESQKTAKTVQSKISSTLSSTKINANNVYKLELRSCGFASDAMIVD